MKPEDAKVIRESIAPLVAQGEVSLLLGAGFSIVNKTSKGRLPGGEELRDLILDECKKKPGVRTSLKDAYQLGSRLIPDFEGFLSSCFTVDSVPDWQVSIFGYAWNRIYTTNIDNVLNVALRKAEEKGKVAGEYAFFNYCDPGLLSNTIGRIPIVTIHGTCVEIDKGFIFSTLEYAKVSSKVLDWHRDLAAKIMTGGLVVIGNQLEESDIDTYLVSRQNDYPVLASSKPANWIVIPEPDEIKAENYTSAGYYVIDATAEEFFGELYSAIRPRNIADIVVESVPVIKKAFASVKAMTWFKGAFRHVASEIEEAKGRGGILRHFITGADPDWFYIVNLAHADLSTHRGLSAKIGEMLQSNSKGIGVLHVTGPSGSGKTTAIRSALIWLAASYKCIYEFDDDSPIETSLLKTTIENISEKSIFVFYSAAEYYYAVNYLHDALKERKNNFCLFILEDRSSEYEKNKRQLSLFGPTNNFEMGDLALDDARRIAEKIEEHGMEYEGFSEFSLDRRARIISDKEKGFSGDLLTALFSLTTHENFERKIFQDYHAAKSRLARDILDLVAIVNSKGFHIPLNYIAGCLNVSVEKVAQEIQAELAGVLVPHLKTAAVKCRHRIIANYYFENCISNQGSPEFILDCLSFLSRQFSVEDIKHHPLAYKIYKEIISYEFLYENFFPKASRKKNTEDTYHEGQKLFGKDGIFWLHFGRYYRKQGNLDLAISCFRTGLEYYSSFQTRHLLGSTLVEKYIQESCQEEDLYFEGIQLLDEERMRRGAADAYPVNSMIMLLQKVVRIKPQKREAQDKLMECINMGLRHFKEDQFFMSLFQGQFRAK